MTALVPVGPLHPDSLITAHVERLIDRGLHVRASKALHALERQASTLSVDAQIAVDVAQGRLARATCRWNDAEAAWERVSKRLPQGTRTRTLALALRVDSLAVAGRVREAKAWVETTARNAAGLTDASYGLDLYKGVFHLDTGDLPEASGLLRPYDVELTPHLDEMARWGAAWVLQTATELRSSGLVARLKSAVETSVSAAFGHETTALLLFLHARATLEDSVRARGDSLPGFVRQVIRQAKAYSLQWPLYQSLLHCLECTLASLEGQRGATQQFDRAASSLEKLGAPLWLGRVLGWQASLQTIRLQKSSQPLLARGRDLLSKAGADGWSRALIATSVGEDVGQSRAVSRSLLAQSVLGNAPGDQDDVQLQAVFEVNRAIASTLEVDDLLARILQEVTKVLKAERGVVVLKKDDGTFHCVAALGVDRERVRDGEGEIPFSVFRAVERDGGVLLTDNAQMDTRLRANASVMASDVRSILCAPLKTQKGLLGFLYLDSTLKSRVFQESHRELLSVFATQGATALENASVFREVENMNRTLEVRVEQRTSELKASNASLREAIEMVRNTELKLVHAQKEALEKEMNVAREIQETIVPGRQVITRPSVRLLGAVEAASHVGGDFWTWLPLTDGSTIFMVGDVTGHGVGSGMVTTVAKSCCDTLMEQSGVVEVGALLKTLSIVIHGATHGRMTMTAFAARVAADGQKIEVANAGHNAPYLLAKATPGSRPKPLMLLGKRLGDLPVEPFVTKDFPVLPGDRLVLFTDGLVECTNAANVPYSERRFQKLLASTAALPLEEQFESVTSDYRTFFGTHPREDDVTLLIAELTTGPQA